MMFTLYRENTNWSFRVHPLVVTLGTFALFRGIAFAISKGVKRVEWVEVDQIAEKNKAKKEELSTH